MKNSKGSTNSDLVIDDSGSIGIGTTTPDEKLTVNGNIHALEVRVDLSVPGPDYVFEEDYDLKSLEEIEQYIQAHKHLPEIPSAKEMETEGIEVGVMNMLLLKKVEELTLHSIAQQKEIQRLKPSKTSPVDEGREDLSEAARKLEKKLDELTRYQSELLQTIKEQEKRIQALEKN